MPRAVHSIVDLEGLVQALPAEEQQRYRRILRIDPTVAELRTPPSVQDWIREYFGSPEAAQQQCGIQVTKLSTADAWASAWGKRD